MKRNKILLKIGGCFLAFFAFIFLLWLIGFRFGILFAPGCSSIELEPGDIAPPTGCFSKSAGFFLSYSPKRCLRVGVGNCLRPQIDLENLCNQNIVVGGRVYDSTETYIYLDKESSGAFIKESGKIGFADFWVVAWTFAACQ